MVGHPAASAQCHTAAGHPALLAAAPPGAPALGDSMPRHSLPPLPPQPQHALLHCCAAAADGHVAGLAHARPLSVHCCCLRRRRAAPWPARNAASASTNAARLASTASCGCRRCRRRCASGPFMVGNHSCGMASGMHGGSSGSTEVSRMDLLRQAGGRHMAGGHMRGRASGADLTGAVQLLAGKSVSAARITHTSRTAFSGVPRLQAGAQKMCKLSAMAGVHQLAGMLPCSPVLRRSLRHPPGDAEQPSIRPSESELMPSPAGQPPTIIIPAATALNSHKALAAAQMAAVSSHFR
jgi:hypothetical protein